MKKILLTLVLGLGCLLQASATDVYAYKYDDPGTMATAINIKRIEFKGDNIVLVSESGSQTLPKSSIDYLMTHRDSGKTGVDDILAADDASALSLVFDGENLIATSNADDLQMVAVYAVSGSQLVAVQPNADQAVVSASSLPAGIYFAKAAAGNAVKTLKFVKH